MFDHTVELSPLTSISASPPNGFKLSSVYNHHPLFDSIMNDEQRLSVNDFLFEKTGQRRSVLSNSILGNDQSHSCAIKLLPHGPHHFCPLLVPSLWLWSHTQKRYYNTCGWSVMLFTICTDNEL